MLDPRPCVISIYAPSGSGKSQLAKQTAAILGEAIASRVAVDNFLVPRPAALPRDVFDRLPLRYDWPELGARLALPLGTPTSAPDVDFETFFRRAETGGPVFTVCPVMLLDAMEPFPGADARVLLAVPDAVRLDRIAERDIRWGTNVRERTGHLDATWRRVCDMGIVPDLVLDGVLPLEQNAQTLATWIRERMHIACMM
jgi:uridine kinase